MKQDLVRYLFKQKSYINIKTTYQENKILQFDVINVTYYFERIASRNKKI
jgi:hypothetical protein